MCAVTVLYMLAVTVLYMLTVTVLHVLGGDLFEALGHAEVDGCGGLPVGCLLHQVCVLLADLLRGVWGKESG